MAKSDVYLQVRRKKTTGAITVDKASSVKFLPTSPSIGISDFEFAIVHFSLEVEDGIFDPTWFTDEVIRVGVEKVDKASVVAGLRSVKTELKEIGK